MIDSSGSNESKNGHYHHNWWQNKSIITLALLLLFVLTIFSGTLAYFSFISNQAPERLSDTSSISPVPTNTNQDLSAQPTKQPGGTTDSDVIPKAQTTPIDVYFSKHPDSDANFQAVFKVTRKSVDTGVAKAALLSLFAGPTSDEVAQGLYSAWNLSGVSNCGVDGFRLEIGNGKAVVRLCRDFSSAGTGQDARARAEADATLLQFPTISKTAYLSKNGDCLFDQSGLNRCLSNE